jgi:plastocyanin
MKKNLLCIFSFFSMIASLSAQVTHDVGMTGVSFNPANITVNENDIVRWTNMDASTPHTSTSGSGCSPSGLWTSTVAGGAQFSRTFATPGTYPYYCQFHCAQGMTGTITVNAVSGIINNKVSSTLNIAPNPFTDFVTLTVDQNNNKAILLKVMDITGKEKRSFDLSMGGDSFSLDLSELPAGLYFCNLYTNNGIVETKKLFHVK